MKLRNIAIAFLGSILFATCGKDDEGDKLYTPEESKAIVKSTMDNFYNCLKKANDGGFANFSMMVFSKDLTEIIPMERRHGSIS